MKFVRLAPSAQHLYSRDVFESKDTNKLRVLAIGKDSWIAVEADWWGSTNPYKRKMNGMQGEKLHSYIDPIMASSEKIGFYWIKKSMVQPLKDEVLDNKEAVSYLESGDPW